MPETPDIQPAARTREAFLVEMSDRLRGRMSPFEVDDTVREVRTHLIASASAFEELGLEPVEAMRAAIDRFGKAEPIEEELVRETRLRARTGSPFVSGGIGAAVGAVLFLGADAAIVATHFVQNPSPETAIIGLAAGFLIGWSLNRRPRTAAVAALRSGLLVPTWILAFVCLLNGILPGAAFTWALFVAFGTASAITAFVTQTLTRRPFFSRVRS